ncbi:interleukin-4 receptor subunit alpha [Astyanax mexicanus]|uniref:interleukin-4 receptor subunit alpha n=1 Tax=Astyanax mexicanus TaxID=7994 RepID=UPI0020CAD583|nr:interleukin-4 receptor subunit alpha [Astyanax mexicanus]
MSFVFCFLAFVCFSHVCGNLMSLGGNYSLQCLNDYLFTISCELNVSSDLLEHGATSWLEFYDLRDPFRCMLRARARSQVCELDLSVLMIEDTFTDTDFFQISLNSSYHGNSSSAVLDTDYRPFKHIRPVTPSNLTLLWKEDGAVFHWLSGYEKNTSFVQSLQYQFNIQNNNRVHNVHPVQTRVVVAVSEFLPHTEYMARVRSQPKQPHYEGVWSHWGPAIHWTTGAIHKGDTQDTTFPGIWFALFCLLPLLVLLLSYLPYSRWKKRLLIPSPAPYIRDLKSCAVLPGIVAELLQREESLKIESMIEYSDHASPCSPAGYEKMKSVGDCSEPTFITPSGPPASHIMLYSPAGAELGSGSWLKDFTTVERGSVTCSEDYCTLSPTDTENST